MVIKRRDETRCVLQVKLHGQLSVQPLMVFRVFWCSYTRRACCPDGDDALGCEFFGTSAQLECCIGAALVASDGGTQVLKSRVRVEG